MTHRLRVLSLALGVAAVASCAPSMARQGEPDSPRPRLVVVLAVDQMRTAYAERFIGQWSGGLKRLFEDGAWFTRAAYPYLNTVTCAGHATIATGTVPAVHGMVLNEWWDRDSQRVVHCTEDAGVEMFSYGGPVKGGHSPRFLKVSTLSDELRRRAGAGSRVVTLSIKPRSAIMLAGHGGDVVLWRQNIAWATSAAFVPRPVPLVAEWLTANPVERDRARVWDRSLPQARYLFADTPVGKKPPVGWGPSLPHPLAGDRADDDPAAFDARWRTSPFADEYLGRLAAHLVERMKLGQQGSTDYLGVGFSALDSIGHKFGPESHEVQDALVRLDAAIGRLLETLDRLVGRDRYVVALSSDHGVSEVPEQMAREGHDAGRVVPLDVAGRVEEAVRSVLGPGRYVARVLYTDVYFRPGVYEQLKAHPAAMAAAGRALLATPGVMKVYRSHELTAGTYGDDPLARAARLSHHPGRSGDLILVPRPNWIASSDAATHGTAHPYDVHVPVVFMGAGVTAGRYTAPATPADIAPTLARIAAVRLPEATGRPLNDAFSPPAAPPTAERTAPASPASPLPH